MESSPIFRVNMANSLKHNSNHPLYPVDGLRKLHIEKHMPLIPNFIHGAPWSYHWVDLSLQNLNHFGKSRSAGGAYNESLYLNRWTRPSQIFATW